MEKEILNKNVIETKDNSNITIVPFEVDNILEHEVRIAECYARNDIRVIRVSNDFLSIAKLLEKISEGYSITTVNFDENLVPFFQQVFLIDYSYGDDPDFKQELKDKNIFPTFIIEHAEGGFLVDPQTAILVYCFKEPIRSEQSAEDIYNTLWEKIFNSKHSDDEICWYSAYDCGSITNLTISNIVYVPVVNGVVSYGD